MFGNLKNKLSESTDLKKFSSPQLLNSLTGSRQRSSQHTPGSHTPSIPRHSRQPSDVSLSAVTNTSIPENDEKSMNSSDLNTLNYGTKDSGKLEKEIQRLKSTLESQQDVALQRLSSKELDWQSKLEQEHNKVSLLQKELRDSKKRENNLSSLLAGKEKENALNNEVLVESKDSETRLINLQDNYDELEGLSAQEVAKTKHMLLNTTADFEKSKSELEEKSRAILELEKRINTYEGIEERMRCFSDEKMDIETKLAGLSHKLNSANAKLSTQSEKYAEEMNHMKEKLDRMNRRQSQSSMDEDEKNEDMIKEREIYEHKLEEARQQLSNIKSSWSDKITSLEAQIQHLNKKIMEDQMDLRTSEENNEKLRKRIEELDEDVKTKEEMKESEMNSLRRDANQLKEDIETAKWQLQTETEKRDNELKEMATKLRLQDEKLVQFNKTIQSKKAENSSLNETIKELERNLDKSEKEKNSWESKCSTLSNSKNSLQELVNRETASIQSIEAQMTTLKEKYDTACSEKTKLSTNLDTYSERVSELEHTIKTLESEKASLSDKHTRMEENTKRLETKNLELTTDVNDLEKDFVLKVEESDLVKELRVKLKSYEDEVTEKKQMLKVHSQRLADMKKTFQKELRINPDSADHHTEANGENPYYLGSNFASHTQPKSRNSPSSFVPYKTPSSQSRNGDVGIDDVNLEYLKHVVLKFISSREYEALQLTKAVSTLLHMTSDEENLLRETLEWKMSWFGSRPNVGTGQSAKGIPPQ